MSTLRAPPRNQVQVTPMLTTFTEMKDSNQSIHNLVEASVVRMIPKVLMKFKVVFIVASKIATVLLAVFFYVLQSLIVEVEARLRNTS